MTKEFVHLHTHTNLGSLLDALQSVEGLFDLVNLKGQKALAITDHGTLTSHFDAFQASKKTGIKFIPGCEAYFVHSYDVIPSEGRGRSKTEKRKHIVLLAQNALGYENLLRINYEGFKHFVLSMGRVFPRIGWEILEKYNEGIIVTSACGNGIIARCLINEEEDKAIEYAKRLAQIFDERFYIEIQPHALKDEKSGFDQIKLNNQLITIAKKLNLPLVAAVDAHYLSRADEKIHDVLLAINSKKAVDDPNRHKYGIDEFYVKDGQEVYDFLLKHHGQEVAEEAVNNTLVINDRCENPIYMETEGNHLPVFDPSAENDYESFLEWKEQSKIPEDLAEDKAYMRFKIVEGFKKKFAHMSVEERKKRWNRVKKELKILEGNNFSSYMLVTADYIKWAKENDILVGVGRGCTTEDTYVLTECGFKNIKEIQIGDLVYTHTGELKKVTDTFEYDVDEKGIDIKTQYSFGTGQFTGNHKLRVAKKVETKEGELFRLHNTHKNYVHYCRGENVEWLRADRIEKGDYIFTPTIKRDIIFPKNIDLAKYCDENYQIFDNTIYKNYYKNRVISNRKISDITGQTLKTISNYKKIKKYNHKIDTVLKLYNISYDDWANEDSSIKYNRFVPRDKEFFYIIGRWIGDGSIKDNCNYSYYISFSCNDQDSSIEKIVNYFNKMGFVVKSHYKKEQSCIDVCIYDKVLVRLFREMFPHYNNTSQTKYLGDFRNLPDGLLISMLNGIIDSDGYKRDKLYSIITSSPRMINELREVMFYLSIPSSVSFRQGGSWKQKDKEYYRSPSYSIDFSLHDISNVRKRNIVNNGYFSKVTDLNDCQLKKIYDIQVEDDHSYVTQNYASHNSVGGCIIAYLLDIHGVDPFDYNLLFERFQNAYKKDLPDIDTDFTSSGRDKVQEYVRNKYGIDNCAHVSNINTYTPKNVIPDLVKSMRNVMPELVPEGTNYVKVAEAIKASIPDLDSDGKKVKTLEYAMELSPKLREFSQRCPELIEYASKIISMPKEFSTHAAGVVISDIPIYKFAPLRLDKNGVVAVQLEKNRCEAMGLVKMDFLAISTLDIIDETFKNIAKLGIENAPKQMEDIPLDDAETYEMIQKGQTKCVFQLGKSGIMALLCKRIKPENILDIAMVNALGRPAAKGKPGERGARDIYLDRRSGKEGVTYPHSSLSKALNETYGLAITEEQLMSLAGSVAGWDLNKADKLRKFTKIKGKDPDFALQLEAEFIEGMMKTQGVDYELAKHVWDKYVAGFGGYGFNKCLDSVNFFNIESSLTPFKELKVGHNISTFNIERNIIEESKIKDIGKTDRKMEVLELSFSGGGKVRVTPNHKFLTPTGYHTVEHIIQNSLPLCVVDSPNMDWQLDVRTPNGQFRQKIIDGYNEHKSIKKTSKIFKISEDKVKNSIQCGNFNEKHTICNRFSDGIIDEQTAYWFGFLCADGNVNKYKTSLELACYDIKHLEKFSKFIKDDNCFFYTRNRKNSRSICYSINSYEFSKSLRLLGIPNNKNIKDIITSKIPERFIKDFIRGFFDGDGSVSRFYYKGKRINVGFRGRLKILTYIKEHLHKELSLSDTKISKDGNSHSLWFRSKDDVYKIYKYFYNNSSIYLSRKRIRLERFFNNKDDFKPWENIYRQSYEGYKKIKSVRKLGLKDTFYIEVESNNHNYIMDGGVISANSHAVFYSINGYITAYLKCHYPAAFLAAYLKVKTFKGGLNKDDEINSAKMECRRLGIRILPPDINRSGAGYEVLDSQTIVMGLSAIKGMGEKALNEIIEKQEFCSFTDFLYRVDARVINKTKVEVLAKAGCFDSFNFNRKDIHDEGKKIRDKMNNFLRKRLKDGYDADMAISDFPITFSGNEWSKQQKLRYEQEVLGELVSGNIDDLYPGFFTNIGVSPISKLKSLPNRHKIIVEVIVKSFLREFKIKSGRYKGKKMAKYLVQDLYGSEVELTVWPSEYEMAKKKMTIGCPIRASCEVSDFNGAKTLMLKELQKVYGS